MSWIILRTRGRDTLGLAKSLGEDGFDVWTPVETKTVTIPRVNVKREVKLPLLKSYIFAQARHLVDLLQLADMPVKPRRGAGLQQPAHAAFSVLHAFGGIPIVADHHLAALRRLEAKRTPRKVAAYTFPRNDTAKVTEGPYGGLVGLVIRSTPAKTLICIGGAHKVEIPTSLLEPTALQDDQATAVKVARRLAAA